MQSGLTGDRLFTGWITAGSGKNSISAVVNGPGGHGAAIAHPMTLSYQKIRLSPLSFPDEMMGFSSSALKRSCPF